MKQRIFLLLSLLLLGSLIGWRLTVKKRDTQDLEKASQARKTATPAVEVKEAVRRDIVHTFNGIGSIEAPYNVKISSKVTGLLQSMNLREGDKVTAGQVVATIDPSATEAQVHQQEALVAEAKARLAQANLATNSTNVGITAQIQQQNAAVNSATAFYKQVQENYKSQVAAAQSSVIDAQGRLDSATSAIANAKANLASAKANLANAQAKLNRSNALFAKGFIAAQDVEDKQTQVAVSQSGVEVAQGQIDGAISAQKSAQAQKDSAQFQAGIVKTKGVSDIEAARSSLVQSRAALAVAKSNTSQKFAYQENLNALRSAVDVAEAQLRNARSLLNDTVLHSSVSGYVSAKYLDSGTVVTAGTPIISVQSARQVYMTTSVSEEISPLIHKGMSASVELDALPGKTFIGAIQEINPAAELQSRQFVLRVTLDNPENKFKPGMYGRVRIVTERFANAVVAPREAIKRTPKGAIVTVIDSEGIAHLKPVETGPEDALGIAVTDGLSAGDKVVTLSQNPLKEGQKVKIGGAK